MSYRVHEEMSEKKNSEKLAQMYKTVLKAYWNGLSFKGSF